MKPGSPFPAILALHGFTGDGRDFEALRRHAPEAWRWVAPDLPGHGRRAAPPFPDGARALESCIELIGTHAGREDRPPVLLGYSMGGRIAMHAALADPTAYRGLVLVGAGPGLRTAAARRERREADAALADRISELGVQAFLEDWWSRPLLRSQWAIPEPWGSRWRSRRLGLKDPAGWAWALRNLGTGALPSLWERLPELDLPVLLIHGEADGKFARVQAEMARRLRRAIRREIPGAGHTAHAEAPGATAALLADWAARLPPPSK